MNTVGSKSLGSIRALQSITKHKRIEYDSDLSDEQERSAAPTTPPAPATSPEPPAIDPIDLDDLDEDERDALEVEQFAARGCAPRRTELPKRTHQRYSPPPPKTRALAPVIPVVVEDDAQEEHPAPPSAPTRPSLPPYDPYAYERRRRAEMAERGYVVEADDEGYDPD